MMTNDEILKLAHREAWRYTKSSDPHHSDIYTFNRATLLEFARKLVETEREACAQACLDRAKDQTGKIKTPFDYKEEAILCAVTIRARSNASYTADSQGLQIANPAESPGESTT